MDGKGFLFQTNGGHLQLLQVADGDTVTLGGGRKWQARHTAEGLQLTIGHVESNAPQQVRGRKTDMKNEPDHRKQEVQALRAQFAGLEIKLEQVIRGACIHAYVAFRLSHCLDCANSVIPVQTQDEDDEASDETSGKDLMELISLIRRHISQIARLEGLREVELEVNNPLASRAGAADARAAGVGTCAVQRWGAAVEPAWRT